MSYHEKLAAIKFWFIISGVLLALFFFFYSCMLLGRSGL